MSRRVDWRGSVAMLLDRRVITMLFLGFSAGVPLLLVFSTLSVWLREAEMSRATIGFFSWAGLGYGFKFVWAPVIDRLPLPVLSRILGRRRSWLLVSQFAVMATLVFMGLTDPAVDLATMAGWAVILGFSSATQDIVIDAYRIEAAEPELQGMMSATYIAGYRIGMLVAGAGALEMAGWLDVVEGYQYSAWSKTYVAMAGVMLVGVVTTLVISEPETTARRDRNLRSFSDYVRFVGCFVVVVAAFVGCFLVVGDWVGAAKTTAIENWGMARQLAGFLVETVRLGVAVLVGGVVARLLITGGVVPGEMVVETYLGPFIDFFRRYGRVAVLILALIATYRIADVVMGVMANVFYVDLGFEKQEIGRISKFFGLIMTILGGLLGGVLTVCFGVMRTLFLGAVLAAATNVLFVFLAQAGPDISMLMVVISADNLSAGIASAAFVAYLSGLTSNAFTATQYALFSSIMVLLPKVLAGYSGMMVDSIGYVSFFIGTALLGVPVLVLIVLVAWLTRRG